MYQFQVWSRVDRNLVAKERSKQPIGSSRARRKLVNPATPFQHSYLFTRHLPVAPGLLLAISLMALSGCGGLSYKGIGSLSGTPESTASNLRQISCGTQSLVGAQTKACSVDLSAKTKTAVQISLQSSNAALQVPATVSVPSGTQSALFNIVASNVTQPLTVTISATVHGHKKSTAITLYPPMATSPSLTKVSCTTQSITGPATDSCSVSLSTAPTSQVVVMLHSSSTYLTVPPSISVAAGSSTVNFQATALAVSSQVTATITASLAGVSISNSIQLNAASATTPAVQHVVHLTWSPPPSLTDLAGYHVYRSSAGASVFQLVSSTLNTQPSYADDAVASGQSYDYEVTSVNSSGVESYPSNITTVSIP